MSFTVAVAKMMILYANFALDGSLTARSFLLCEIGFVEHGETGFIVFTVPGAVQGRVGAQGDHIGDGDVFIAPFEGEGATRAQHPESFAQTCC